MRRAAFAALLLALGGLAGCGGGSRQASAPTFPLTQPPTTTPAAVVPPPAAASGASGTTAPRVPTPQPPATAQPQGETGSAGAGDEQPAATPVAFRVGTAGLHQSRRRVPAFLALSISLSSTDGAAHTLALAGTPGPYTLQVGPRSATAQLFAGLKPGRYRVVLDGHPLKTTLVVGEQ